jgi:tripartite-type tricarboxylate transporter receptor subunit TctC
MKRSVYLLGVMLAVTLSPFVLAQTSAWPQKPIKIVVPNPAGGTADLLPRLISEGLTTRLGQNVIVENRAGAAGNIGAEFVYNAEPDGYTLLASPPTTLAINVSLYPKLGYEPAKFSPVSILALVPNALMVHPSVPVNTVQEFIAYAKANPDKVSYASQGNGSTAHLTAELFKQKTGTKLTHIPYKGDAPAMADLLAGHVNVMFGNVAQAGSHLKTGKLKVLAVTSSKRIASMPNVPALAESVPGVVVVTWFAVAAPPKTPAAVVNRLSSTIAEVLRTSEILRRLNELGAEPVGSTAAEMGAWMREDTERWSSVIKAGGITID